MYTFHNFAKLITNEYEENINSVYFLWKKIYTIDICVYILMIFVCIFYWYLCVYFIDICVHIYGEKSS